MSDASRDFLKRSDRERVRVFKRVDEYRDEFHDDEHALSCFKIAVCELTEEEEWKRILDRTRALLAKIKS